MTATDAEIPVPMAEEETGRKSWIPAWAKLPQWTPTALIGSALLLLSFALYNALNIVVRLLLALHESSIPWWGAFFVYAFIGGALYRASKEFKVWVEAAKNRWGVFTRWAKALV